MSSTQKVFFFVCFWLEHTEIFYRWFLFLSFTQLNSFNFIISLTHNLTNKQLIKTWICKKTFCFVVTYFLFWNYKHKKFVSSNSKRTLHIFVFQKKKHKNYRIKSSFFRIWKGRIYVFFFDWKYSHVMNNLKKNGTDLAPHKKCRRCAFVAMKWNFITRKKKKVKNRPTQQVEKKLIKTENWFQIMRSILWMNNNITK